MSIPFWALIPFAVQLIAIALVPVFWGKFWERNRNKMLISIVLSIPVFVFMFANQMGGAIWNQILFDYFPFIILLCALFVITGGIFIGGDFVARPSVNTAFLAIGYILASFMGTTGAAILLIRPLLNANRQRKHKTHTILFFIAAVANCGGLLTPLGDPPLFLLHLRGANFSWFLQLFPQWLFAGAMLLAIYYFIDYKYFRKESWESISADLREKIPFHIKGNVNFLFLLGVIAAVAFINPQYFPSMNFPHTPLYIKFLREIILIILIFLSLFLTKKTIRQRNKFTWQPIIEVAVIFFSIFVTITPVLLFLNYNAQNFAMTKPWHFYYATGTLSAFLDNAPTALAFHSIAQGLPSVGTNVAGISESLLKAISVGSVFFGSMTYIGNGPNFMVKLIAEENSVKMPSFFAYILKFSLVVLLPIYILTQLLFV